MEHKTLPSINTLLRWLVALCVLPCLLLLIAYCVHQYYRERALLVTQSRLTVHAIKSAIDADLHGIETSLRVLASSPFLTQGNAEAFQAYAHEVMKEQTGVDIVLTDRHGNPVPNNAWPNSLAKGETGIGPALNEGLRSHISFSDLHTSSSGMHPYISMDIPAGGNDESPFILSAHVHPQHIVAILLQQPLPNDWTASVIDSEGRYIARTHEMHRYLGHEIERDLFARIHAAGEDSYEHRLNHEQDVISVFSRSGMANWSILISMPTAGMQADLIHTLGLLFVFSNIILAVCIVLASQVGRRIASSIHDLSAPALALGFGREVHVPRLGLKEVNELGQSIEKASLLMQRAQYEANHDALTGLVNRALFHNMVQQEISVCQRSGNVLSLLYIDLDEFKRINDDYGHIVGDELLKSVAHRLLASIRDSDIAARLGGDEFAVLLVHADQGSARKVATKLVENLSRPYPLGDIVVTVSASIGIAAYPESAAQGEALIDQADRAMYDAKRAGKQRFALAPAM